MRGVRAPSTRMGAHPSRTVRRHRHPPPGSVPKEGTMPVTLPPQSVRWLADHHGVITTQVLREHGIGATATRRLVERGLLHRVGLGVFVSTSTPRTVEQRCAVLSASHRGGFVTGPTAGMLAGLRRMPRRSPIHFAVLHGVHLPDDPGVRFRQTTVIWAIDRRVRDDGIVVASWPRLAFDLAADLHQLDHLSVVQQLLHERRVTRDDLVAIDRRLGHPARSGFGCVPPHARVARRLARQRVASRGRAGGRATKPGRSSRAPDEADPTLQRAVDARRSRRAGSEMGRRAGHPS